MAYRFAVIDTSTEIWDPPPSRLASERITSGTANGRTVYLEVLDSNLRFTSGISAFADLPSRPCDDMDALAAGVIDSARTSTARLTQRP